MIQAKAITPSQYDRAQKAFGRLKAHQIQHAEKIIIHGVVVKSRDGEVIPLTSPQLALLKGIRERRSTITMHYRPAQFLVKRGLARFVTAVSPTTSKSPRRVAPTWRAIHEDRTSRNQAVGLEAALERR